MRIRLVGSRFRLMAVVASAVAVAGMAGCGRSPIGEWYVNTFEPASARGSFESGRLALHSDHTYAASARCGGKDWDSRGTWTFDGQSLTFRDQTGAQRRYSALVVDGTHMKVYSEMLGLDVVAVFKRPEPRKSGNKEASR